MGSITKLKKQLENNQSFQYWNKEGGLSFEDFDLVDIDTNRIISHGKKDIGNYILYLKDDVIDSAIFDLDNEPIVIKS